LAQVSMAAPGCSVRDKVPQKARIFAKADDENAWREYPNAGQAPELSLSGGMSAQLVQRKKENPSVTIVKPGESYWTYTRYCYGDDGLLANVSLEMRTALGWGYRVEGTASGTAFNVSKQEFFRTKNGKPIAKPEGVADAPANVQPTLYLKVSDLPFASLLKPPAKARANHHATLTRVSTGN
jgi:hypothetical protein